MVYPCNSSESPPNPANIDRISELPDEILEYVTSKLTLRDAIKTKVLSSRWKRMGVSSRSNLVFDWINIFETRENSQLWDAIVEDPCDQFRVRFVESVNEFLGSIVQTVTWRIQDFTINFCLGVDYQDDIDKWVRFALSKGAQNLKLKFHCVKKCKSANASQLIHPNHYIFPCIIPDDHRCVPAASLKTLSLEPCYPGQSLTNTRIFGCLSFLKLCYVDLKGYDLSSMFSCLQKLKTLIFMFCDLPKVITLRSLVSLRRCYVLFSSGVERIEILNPKLVCFHCVCSPEVQITLVGQEISNIMDFCFVACENSWDYTFARLSKDMPNLRRLYLFAENDRWGDGLPPTMSIVTFAHVTCVTIFLSVRGSLDLSKMIRALKAFPKLRKLCIVCAKQVSLMDFEHDEHVYEHLEEIEFLRFCATSKEIQLLIYLLAHAPSLKTLVIDPNVNDDHLPEDLKVREKRLMGNEERQEVRESLHPFSRDVEIIFK